MAQVLQKMAKWLALECESESCTLGASDGMEVMTPGVNPTPQKREIAEYLENC
jgi:hypothetical protein